MNKMGTLKMHDGSEMYIVRGSKKDKPELIKMGWEFKFPNIAYAQHADGRYIHYNHMMKAWIIEK